MEEITKQDQWDIVLDPIEQEPGEQYSSLLRTLATNWGRDLLLPESLWDAVYEAAQRPVIIKIGDTGQPDHKDLLGALIPGKNYSSDASLADGNGHSTHVGGIISAEGFGLLDPIVKKGLAKVKYCKVLTNSGSGSFSWMATMIAEEDAENQKIIDDGGAVVINFSLGGGTTPIQSIEDALAASVAKGVVYCVAAGNSSGAVQYPGLSVYTKAVSSIDRDLSLSYYSSRGPEVDYTAPGNGILSTYKGNTYATLSGTSMATPFVTSLVAIAMSVWPKLTSEDLPAYFEQIAEDLGESGKDNLFGYGLVFVQSILDTPPYEEEPDPDPTPDPEPPKKSKLWMWIGIGAGAAIAVGVIIWLILR